MSPLTPDDLILIQGMIDRAISCNTIHATKKKLDTGFHSAKEIRNIIIQHIDELRLFVGESEFPIGTVKAFVKKYAKLRPGDLVVLNRSHIATRFDGQVTNVFNNLHSWPENPFILVRRGHYRLRPVASQLEI